tara:strand:+ start:93 stop:866 length:774 start_codon:yes stop_codon:yes gene_type:complete
MSRFGTGLGFNIQDIALISGIATEILTANVLNFDGVNNDMYAPAISSGATSLSVSFWIDLSADNVQLFHVPSNALARIHYQITAQGGGLTVQVCGSDDNGNSAYSAVLSELPITLNTKTHIVFEYDGTGSVMRVYLDSVLKPFGIAGAIPPALSVNTMNFALGEYPATGALKLNGEFYMFGERVNRPLLTQEEVDDLFNAGTTPCFDVLDIAFDRTVTFANWVGNTGNELIDTIGGNNFTNAGATPFTGSAQIECEA